jgi:proliferating cell nuclear antigen
MHLKTIQANAIRSVFEVLKDIINDVNVYFSADGVKILTLDTARVTLIHMHLGSENFEEYECEGDIVAGLNITNTYKLLKSMSNNDTLTIDIVDRDYMQIVIQNVSKNTNTKFSLKLLDINEDALDVPDIEMDVITTMPSVDFQRIVRDMANLSTEMRIVRNGKSLELSCIGDFANQTTVIEYPECDAKTCVGNVFSLKYINLFTKATGMCSSVQLMQDSEDENMPIIFRYTIANLGEIKFYLAPKVE